MAAWRRPCTPYWQPRWCSLSQFDRMRVQVGTQVLALTSPHSGALHSQWPHTLLVELLHSIADR